MPRVVTISAGRRVRILDNTKRKQTQSERTFKFLSFWLSDFDDFFF